MEFINKSGLEFIDISSEIYREYRFANLNVRIENPLRLCISDHGHRIYDGQGISHYIPKGWYQLSWKVKEGCPNFVK